MEGGTTPTFRLFVMNQNPYMRDMDDLEIFLIKLTQDRTAIELDEEELEDEEVEVAAEPEYSIS